VEPAVKVLIVTPYPVLPPTHGGRVRTYQLATALGADAEVDVLCPWAPGEPLRRFQREGVTFKPHFLVGNVLPRLFPDRLLPSLVALSLQPFALGPRRRLRKVAAYDVVQFEFCAHSSWMERIKPRTKVVYSAHNVEYDFWRGQADGAAQPAALQRLEALERQAVHASDLVIASTDADAARLRELYEPETEVAVVENGFDESLLHLDRAALGPQTRARLGIPPTDRVLIFVGGPAAHNRAAAAFLEQELAPQLGEGVTMLLVGRAARTSRRVGDPQKGTTVRRLGYVEDLAPLLAAADVALNPVEFGSGSNLKLPEYLAAGLSVVTTPIGMRGFERLRDCLTVAELDRFATAIRTAEPVPASTRETLARWTWRNLGHRLHQAYERLLGETSSLPSRPEAPAAS
jgi:glycosyltransferase involved in cell wall biosynthesis